MSATLSPKQLETVRLWASQGVDLNGIQKNLASECGLHMTFMEVRFLLLDHGIEISSPAAEQEKPESDSAKKRADGVEGMEEASPADGRLQVTLDDLQIPGTLLSGKAVFPSGTRGSWQIDQSGRFGWSELSGTPTPVELQDFQYELTQLLSRG